MKIKNLAFFGIMAAILGVNGAARADSTTIIASQAYVDAKDALKQDQDKRYENTLTTYNGLNKTDDQQKEDYPSMYTLKQAITTASSDASNMKDTAASATWANNTLSIVTTENAAGNKTDKVATSNQVQTSISALKSYTDYSKQAKSTANYSMGKSDGTWEAMSQTQQDALNSGIDSTKVAQIATNTADIATNAGNISTNAGNISTNASAIRALNEALEKGLTDAQETAYNDWIAPEKGNRKYEGEYWTALVDALETDVDNVVSDYQQKHQNLIPRNRNIQKGIAYLKGNGIENYTPGVKNDATANVGIKNGTVKEKAIKAWNDNLSEHGDEFVPTVASVERRVQAAEAAAGSGLTGMKDTTAFTARDENNQITKAGDDDHFSTTKAISDTLKSLDADLNATDNHVVTGVTEVDGKLVSVDSAQITTSYVASSALATSGSGNNNLDSTTNAVDTKLVTEKAVADALDGKANAQTVTNNDTNANSLVTVNSQGVVTGKIAAGALAKKSVITYATDTDSKLSNVNASGDAGTAMTNCTLKSPCTLTMIWNNGAPVYEWTNMDTEDTSATL